MKNVVSNGKWITYNAQIKGKCEWHHNTYGSCGSADTYEIIPPFVLLHAFWMTLNFESGASAGPCRNTLNLTAGGQLLSLVIGSYWPAAWSTVYCASWLMPPYRQTTWLCSHRHSARSHGSTGNRSAMAALLPSWPTQSRSALTAYWLDRGCAGPATPLAFTAS